MFSQEFWNTYPLAHGQDEFFKQVGKTVHGEPISPEQFRQIISDIVEYLELNRDDEVLDLCCGNGLISKEIATRCRSIVGVDFSEPLIATARKCHQPTNARYVQRSVVGLRLQEIPASQDELDSPATGKFSKVYMYEALQHLEPEDLEPLLKNLLNFSTDDVVILLASVPDKDRIWDFYNTPERKSAYEERIRLGTDSMGTWWEPSQLKTVCEKLGLRCEQKKQNPILHTSHYRCDWVIRPRTI